MSDNILTVENVVKSFGKFRALDGASLKNADFAATAAQLSTATLNLQFTTDVTLVPAINADLRDNPPAGLVDKSALTAKITEAQAAYDAAEAGQEKDDLGTAITAAQTVANAADATAEQVAEEGFVP